MYLPVGERDAHHPIFTVNHTISSTTKPYVCVITTDIPVYIIGLEAMWLWYTLDVSIYDWFCTFSYCQWLLVHYLIDISIL